MDSKFAQRNTNHSNFMALSQFLFYLFIYFLHTHTHKGQSDNKFMHVFCVLYLPLSKEQYTFNCKRVVLKVMINFFLQANWEQQTKESTVVDGTSCCVTLECLVKSIACIT